MVTIENLNSGVCDIVCTRGHIQEGVNVIESDNIGFTKKQDFTEDHNFVFVYCPTCSSSTFYSTEEHDVGISLKEILEQ